MWEAHRLRFRVRASYHAAFWDHYAGPVAGRLDPELHRWLLEAYALCGRDGALPVGRVDPTDAARTLARARVFLSAVHRHLGLRPPFPPPAD